MTERTGATRRSDTIRQRQAAPSRQNSFREKMRRQQRNTPKGRAGGRAGAKASGRGASYSPPPVVARRVVGSTPVVERPRFKGQKVRRRYHVALNSLGAEMQLPSLPQVRIGWRPFSAALVIFLGGLLYFLWSSPLFKVQSAEVTGLQRVPLAAVNKVLSADHRPVFLLDSLELENQLLAAFPEFITATVSVDLPNQVNVAVLERKPLLTWKQGDQTWLVDAQGIAFLLREGGKPGPAMVVEASGPPPFADPVEVVTQTASLEAGIDRMTLQALGLELPQESEQAQGEKTKQTTRPKPRRLLSPETVRAIVALVKIAPQGTVLVYNADHGLGWKDSRGWEVFLGEAVDMENKLRVYQAIVNRLAADNLTPALISVEYVHAPYYRLKEDGQ